MGIYIIENFNINNIINYVQEAEEQQKAVFELIPLLNRLSKKYIG